MCNFVIYVLYVEHDIYVEYYVYYLIVITLLLFFKLNLCVYFIYSIQFYNYYCGIFMTIKLLHIINNFSKKYQSTYLVVVQTWNSLLPTTNSLFNQIKQCTWSVFYYSEKYVLFRLKTVVLQFMSICYAMFHKDLCRELKSLYALILKW